MKTMINCNGVDLEVTGEYRRGYGGKPYMRNGEPGCPGEAAVIDDIDILHRGESIMEMLGDSVIKEIETLAIERIEDERAKKK